MTAKTFKSNVEYKTDSNGQMYMELQPAGIVEEGE